MAHSQALAPPTSRRLAGVVAVFALLASLLTAGMPQADWRTYLLPAGAPLPAGVRVLRALPVVDGVVVSAPTALPGAVSLAEPLHWRSLAPQPDASGVRLDSGVATTRADQAWATTRGERAVVALVDTGVAPLPVLDGAVAGEIDFSGTGGGDPYGHGTFLASLIAARGPLAPGVAPGTGLLSLKVGGPDGGTSLGAVLAALQWLHGPGRASGIRVATLALGVDPDSDAAAVLDRAVARLARDGVLVVVAAGNDGPGALGSPATAPGSFSLGSVDDQSTPDRSDDVVAGFSATGTDRAGVPQPDAVASGVNVVAWMPQDAVIARTYPQASLGDGLFRGSGTSMSTALAAGVATLASSARPDLDGAALDATLRAAGGELDAPAAVAAALAAPPGDGERGSSGEGAADERGSSEGNRPDNAGRNDDQGAASPNAVHWRAVHWRAVSWRAVSWRGDHWGDSDWALGNWSAVHWRAVHWRGHWAGEPIADDGFEAVSWRALHWR